jgi:hypothetical protein
MIVGRRPLKPDEPELLEETKDYVFYPTILLAPGQVTAGGSSASTLPERAATGGSAVLPTPTQIAAGGSSSVLPPPTQSDVDESSSALKKKSTVVPSKSSPSPQAGSPADQSKKRPTEGGSGGKSRGSKRGRFAGALKSKLLSPPARQTSTSGDNPGPSTLAPPQGTYFFSNASFVFFTPLFPSFSHSTFHYCRSCPGC